MLWQQHCFSCIHTIIMSKIISFMLLSKSICNFLIISRIWAMNVCSCCCCIAISFMYIDYNFSFLTRLEFILMLLLLLILLHRKMLKIIIHANSFLYKFMFYFWNIFCIMERIFVWSIKQGEFRCMRDLKGYKIVSFIHLILKQFHDIAGIFFSFWLCCCYCFFFFLSISFCVSKQNGVVWIKNRVVMLDFVL